MSEISSPTKIDSYRNTIFVSYAVIGFIVAMIVLYNSVDDILSEVSTKQAITFVLITTAFTWVGGAIANAVYSYDDSGDPWSHRWAIIRSLPLGGTVIALLAALTYFAVQVSLPNLIYAGAVGFSFWVRWLVKSRDS